MRLARRLSVLLAACFGLVTSLQQTVSEIVNNDADVLEGSSLPLVGRKGYPQLFTHKTSALLTEALQMLHRAKDVKERRWLEAFVHRLAILASDLEKSTAYLKSPTVASSYASQRQHTVPTTGQISPPPSPTESKGRGKSDVTTQGTLDVARELGKPETATAPSSFGRKENDVLVAQLKKHYDDVRWITTETYSLDSGGEVVTVSPTTPVQYYDNIWDENKVGLKDILEMDSIKYSHKRSGSNDDPSSDSITDSHTSIKTSNAGNIPLKRLQQDVEDPVPPSQSTPSSSPSESIHQPQPPRQVITHDTPSDSRPEDDVAERSPHARDIEGDVIEEEEDDGNSLEMQDDSDTDELVRQLEGEKFQKTVTTADRSGGPRGMAASSRWRKSLGNEEDDVLGSPAATSLHSHKSGSVSSQNAFLIDRALNALKRSRGAMRG